MSETETEKQREERFERAANNNFKANTDLDEEEARAQKEKVEKAYQAAYNKNKDTKQLNASGHSDSNDELSEVDLADDRPF